MNRWTNRYVLPKIMGVDEGDKVNDKGKEYRKVKRIVGVILLALVLTLAMAVPVMADTDVNLDIVEPTIAVDAPNNITLGSSVLRGTSNTYTGTRDGAVSCNAPLGYTVTMSRSEACMKRDGVTLIKAFLAKAGNMGSYSSAAGTYTILNESGPTSGAEPYTLDVSQQIVSTDPTGSYGITLVFAGTVK